MKNRWQWYAVVLIGLVFCLYTNWYYLAAEAQTPAAHWFTGVNLFSGMDKLVYYSMIEQGRQGILFMYNLHTAEPQNGIFFSPHWWLIGQTAAWFKLGTIAAYHWWRLILSLSFVGLVYYGLDRFFKAAWEKITALLFILFSVGVGSFIVITDPGALANPYVVFDKLPVDMYMTEMFPALNFGQSPLFMWSHILIMVIFYLFVRYRNQPNWRSTGAISLLAFILVAIHPYDIGIIVPVLLAWTAWRFWRQADWTIVRHSLVVVVSSCAAAVLLWIAVQAEPAAAGWLEQNAVYSPAPWNYIRGIGFILPLWLLGSYVVVRYHRANAWYMMAVIWSWLVTLLIYTPVAYNRRFANAWMMPLALVAFIGVRWLLKKIPNLFGRMVTLFVIAAFVFSGTIVHFASQTVVLPYIQDEYKFYLPDEWQAAFEVLRTNIQAGEVVMTNATAQDLTITSLSIPAFVGAPVFVGHQHQTAHFYLKQQQQDEFWSEGTGMDREQFLRSYNIKFLVVDLSEGSDPYLWIEDEAYTTLLFEGEEIRLYRVSVE